MELGNREGARILEQTLADLVRSGIVTQEEAMTKSSNPRKLSELLQPGPYDALSSTDNGKKGLEVRLNE